MFYKKERILLVLYVVVVAYAFSYFYNSNYKKVILQNEYKITNGVLDLSEVEIANNQVFLINGESEFFWEQLLTPEDFRNDSLLSKSGLIHLPGIWNGLNYNGQQLDGFGYGTYHFKIKVPTDDTYALHIKAFDTAYKMWANNVLVKDGDVGTTSANSNASWRRQLLIAASQNKEIEVVLQISNFDHRKGGAEEPMYFGTATAITNMKIHRTIIESFFLGIMTILGIYHLVLFLFMTDEYSNGVFGLSCIATLLRLLTTGEKLIYDIYPSFNWLFIIRVEYLSYTFMLPLMLLFVHSFYPKSFSRLLVKVITIIAGVFALIILFAPPRVFTYTPIYYQFVIIVIAFYSLFAFGRLVIKREKNALIFLLGYLTLFFFIINDILYFNKYSNNGYLTYFGLTTFAFSLSIVLSKKFAEIYINNRNLSEKLELYNRELEATIETRTQFIVDQKDEILEQAKNLKATNEKLVELNAYKESLTQMIIHDLKNPLNIILNFSKDQRVVFAGTQMLNLVQNLLDVQRYENSKMKLTTDTKSIILLIEKAIYQMNFLIIEKNIQLRFETDIDYFVNVDEEVMNRILVNLLSNALKFTPTKGVVLVEIEKKNSNVEVCITDSGPGIPDAQKDIVFEKFGQIIARKSGRLGSSGLGLTFCKMAIEAHDGCIYFQSVLGKGTTFCISLPIVSIQNMPEKESIEITPDKNLEKIEFSNEEKLLLNEIFIQLSELKIYEIGKIKSLIAQIEPQQNEMISLWIKELQNAIWNSDNEKFEFLVKMLKA